METLIEGVASITMSQIIMMLIGGALIYLGIKKEYEPTLLVPMGLGAILVNFPNTGVLTQVTGGSKAEGVLDILFKAGISTELFPLLIFIGIGAMIDFGPLLQNPFMLLFVSNQLAQNLLGPITVAAYSYMALVPIIQPLAIKAVTTKKERQIRMTYKAENVSKTTKILLPIIETI